MRRRSERGNNNFSPRFEACPKAMHAPNPQPQKKERIYISSPSLSLPFSSPQPNKAAQLIAVAASASIQAGRSTYEAKLALGQLAGRLVADRRVGNAAHAERKALKA